MTEQRKTERKITVSPALRAACVANAAKARAALKAKLARGENPWKNSMAKKRMASSVEIPLADIPVPLPVPKGKYKPRAKQEPVSNPEPQADGFADFVAAAWLSLQRQKGVKK